MPILFFILWLLLAGEVTLHVCLWGVVASVILSWFCHQVLGYQMAPKRGTLGKGAAFLRYLGHLVVEMLRAGFVVMRLIYTRGKKMEPKLIWFDTTLKTGVGQAILADSITLTAGTITVLAEDGRFLIHTLDKSLAEGIENCEFQQRLEKLEA